jgi:hypothetical protein
LLQRTSTRPKVDHTKSASAPNDAGSETSVFRIVQRGLAQALLRHVGCNHVRTGVGEPFGQAAADAAPGSGDDGDPR